MTLGPIASMHPRGGSSAVPSAERVLPGRPSAGSLVAGRYRLVGVTGRGATGTVWRARDEVLNRDVALKNFLGNTNGARAEACFAAQVRHPNVAVVHDLVTDGDSWLVMEYHAGGTLADLLRGGRRLPPSTVAGLGVQLLAALRAVHAAGLVHGDVKPSNLLLGEGGRAVLADFGIAEAHGAELAHPIRRGGGVVGTPAYMAPELLRGEAPSPAADLWSMGATLFTAVEGRPPFLQGDPAATAAALLRWAAPSKLAGPLRPLLARLLVTQPAGRPSHDDAQVMLAAAGPDASPAAALPAPRVRHLRVAEWDTVGAAFGAGGENEKPSVPRPAPSRPGL